MNISPMALHTKSAQSIELAALLVSLVLNDLREVVLLETE